MAVGFAAQSTMQNVVSALQIYSTRPFIVGDRVQLKSMSGSTIVAGRLIPDCAALLKSLLAAQVQYDLTHLEPVEVASTSSIEASAASVSPPAGVVEHIAPMRTVLRGDNKLPIYIGNKASSGLLAS